MLATTTTATTTTTNQSSVGASGVGNAKYLRYVKSKLSKSRLNSVLSLAGGPSGSGLAKELAHPTSERPAEQVNNSCSGPESFGGQQQQQVEFARLERQQHLLTNSLDVELVAKQTSKLLRLDGHKPIEASLSNSESLAVEQDAQATSSVRAHVKKSNFFQGFRYTLRGRRGSKQVDSKQHSSSADKTDELQQSNSSNSIASQQSIKLINSKKLKHKLLQSVNLTAAGIEQVSAGQSGCDSPGSDSELASNSSSNNDDGAASKTFRYSQKSSYTSSSQTWTANFKGQSEK